jgi:hypothetical protein
MKPLPEDILKRLMRNGAENARRIAEDGNVLDFYPVVKLFTPDAGCTWLLTEIDPEDPDIAFGLCDLGMGCPELGSVSLAELAAVRGRLGLAIERDRCFKGSKPLSVYTAEARKAGCIRA